MLTIIHLENSRSDRLIWLLEELGHDYEIQTFERDPETQRAPAEMKALHPFAKAPMLRDGDRVLIESGAIFEYIMARYGDGGLVPKTDDPEWPDYIQWLHFAEASGMFPLLLDMFLDMAGEGAAGLKQHVGTELALYLSYMDAELAEREWFAGDTFTAADVLMGFVVEFAATRADLALYANLAGYLERIHARPAYRRAIEKGRR